MLRIVCSLIRQAHFGRGSTNGMERVPSDDFAIGACRREGVCTSCSAWKEILAQLRMRRSSLSAIRRLIRGSPNDRRDASRARPGALVVSSNKRYTHHARSRSNLFQRRTTGAALISSMPLRMRALSSSLEVTRMWRRKLRAIFENTHSIKLSQEPCLGV